MNELFKCLERAIYDMTSNFWAVICGFFTSILGYFMPVKDVVHLLVILFILDVVFGYWAAKKLRGEKFSVKIIWSHTMPRMLISIVLIIGAYMWDHVYNQDFVCTYKIIGWFISGVLLYSIAENGYYITRWGVFKRIGIFFKRKTDIKQQQNNGC